MPANPVTSNEAEFAARMEVLAAEEIRKGDLDLAGYLWDAADVWAEPSEATFAVRMMLLNAALGRQEAGR